MDLSQSELSRKLSGNPDDSRRFTVDDLERFIQATGDVTPIYYLIERFLEDESIKQQRAMAELLKIAPQLAALIKQATNQQPRSPADPHHRTTKTPRPTRRQRVGIEQE